jgi:hypothetical protein
MILRFLIALFGVIAALWNFTITFSAWLLSSQRDLLGVTIMFLFCGLMPIVGVVASLLRKRWGPWILIAIPFCASFAFLFLRPLDVEGVAFFFAVYCAPLVLVGLGFMRLSRGSSGGRQSELSSGPPGG